MQRRSFFQQSAAMAVTGATESAAVEARKPNVILIR